MKPFTDQIDFARVKAAGAKCAELAARRTTLGAELAKAETAISDFQTAREAYSAADDAARKAAAASFRDRPAETKATDRAARAAKARMDELHPLATAAQEALTEIRREIEEVDSERAKLDWHASSATALVARDAAWAKLKQITAQAAGIGLLIGELEALCDLCEDHGMERPPAAVELLSRWRNDNEHKPELGGFVVLNPVTGRIGSPDWLGNPPAGDARAALAVAVEKAAGIPGGLKKHPYSETVAFRRRREHEAHVAYARFARRQRDWADENERAAAAAETPKLRERVAKLETFIRERGYSGV